MSLAMSRSEREAFLADLHVGVISIEEPGGPLEGPEGLPEGAEGPRPREPFGDHSETIQ